MQLDTSPATIHVDDGDPDFSHLPEAQLLERIVALCPPGSSANLSVGSFYGFGAQSPTEAVACRVASLLTGVVATRITSAVARRRAQRTIAATAVELEPWLAALRLLTGETFDLDLAPFDTLAKGEV